MKVHPLPFISRASHTSFHSLWFRGQQGPPSYRSCAARRGGRPRGRGAAAGGEGKEGRRREKNPNNNNKKNFVSFSPGLRESVTS